MKKILCLLFGHDFFLIKKLTPHSRKLGCHRCDLHFAMNDDVHAVIQWSSDVEEMYRRHGVNTK